MKTEIRPWVICWLWMSCIGPLAVSAQDFNWGMTGGLRLWLGTPANQVGLDVRGYLTRGPIQVQAGGAVQYNFTHMGPRPMHPGWEGQTYLGASVGFGPREEAHVSPFLHPVSQQTGRRYALAYAWKWYGDQMQTSQTTALIGLHLGPWAIISENDAYTGRIFDRFRTGTLSLAYRKDSLRVASSVILWTGDPRGGAAPRVMGRGVGRFGYKDLSHAPYGRQSHGIWTLDLGYALPFRQVAHARVGIDAEQVRNALQNRLIHDMPFLPASWFKVRNPHYPMLTPEGSPCVDRDKQKVRPARPYLQIGLNPALFY